MIMLNVGITLEKANEILIMETYKHCEKNKAQTARVLGVSEKTVASKLDQIEKKNNLANAELEKKKAEMDKERLEFVNAGMALHRKHSTTKNLDDIMKGKNEA